MKILKRGVGIVHQLAIYILLIKTNQKMSIDLFVSAVQSQASNVDILNSKGELTTDVL